MAVMRLEARRIPRGMSAPWEADRAFGRDAQQWKRSGPRGSRFAEQTHDAVIRTAVYRDRAGALECRYESV
jgi:hypothetical protein